MPKPRPQSAQFFIRLASITASVLRARAARELSPGMSQSIAQAVAAQVRTEFAGAEFYVPGDQAGRLVLRNDAIRQGFARPGPEEVPAASAARAAQLAREHGLSVRRVRAILSGANGGRVS
jgi:Mor family transcriptional regulator